LKSQLRIVSSTLQRLRRQQRSTFLLASGLSTAGSFAGLTAKGWLLMHGSHNPLLLALHFAMLTLPTLVVSGWAGVLTDEVGSERVLIRAQWGLFVAAVLAAIAIPISQGGLQALLLLASTLGVGIASAYELTARNKYCALLVDRPDELGSYLTSFSVVFNVAKLVGPPIGGLLLATTGPFAALALDAASYLVPIATLLWLMAPNRSAEQRSQKGEQATLAAAWRLCGSALRRVLVFCALACLLGFFHPGLAPLMANELLGPSPQSLGLFTSVIAAGSISGGIWLQRQAGSLSRKPGLLLGGSTLVSGMAQVGLGLNPHALWGLLMAFLIGAGTACLLSGTNLILQVHSPQVLRGRMAGLGQIAFLGGGGLSGLLAAGMSLKTGLWPSFVVLGSLGAALGVGELLSQRNRRLA
jgi:MFS family permease